MIWPLAIVAVVFIITAGFVITERSRRTHVAYGICRDCNHKRKVRAQIVEDHQREVRREIDKLKATAVQEMRKEYVPHD